MKDFDTYFSTEAIIWELVRMRIKIASKRHDAARRQRRSGNKKAARAKASDLDDLFPPRGTWARYRCGSKPRLGRYSVSINAETLFRVVRAMRLADPDAPWVVKLTTRVSAIRSRVLNGESFSFEPPHVFGMPKNPAKHEYRPIAIYTDDDKIISRITACYLRDCFDPYFSDTSMAYRCRQEGCASAVSHHDAMHKIENFRRRYSGLYVAEADIRNFMDCIDHAVTRASFYNLIIECKTRQRDFTIAPRAIQIFEACLASYSFKNQALGQGIATLRKSDPLANFSWPEAELRVLHDREDLSHIGIPQGGAISCIITNIVLHEVDKTIDDLRTTDKLVYLYERFCDDMMILSPEKSTCEKVMRAYQMVLKRKKLLIHKPVDAPVYEHGSALAKGFWGMKSINPYLWASASESGIPWIQFVGYQIRYDALVRIRKKSIRKHAQKITDATDETLKMINDLFGSRRADSHVPRDRKKKVMQIMHSFELRLISMAVGRRKPGQPLPTCADEIMPMCWSKGYKGLYDVSFIESQLKDLDRHRERQLRRVRNRLKLLLDDGKWPTGFHYSAKPNPYYGAPYSYHGQFVRSQERLAECKENGLWLRITNFIQRLKAAWRSRF